MSFNQARYEREFRFFANMCESSSPLYATVARRIADDPRVMRLAHRRQPKQPPSNMLFGAVQYLLLAGADHPLREFYPSVGGHRPAEQAYPVFSDFCREFESQIVELVATRRVQTNEVGRCGVLLPALHIAFNRFERRPLYLIEVGASAGLNLQLDRYRYEYTRAPAGQPLAGARGSSTHSDSAADAASTKADTWRHMCGDPDSPVRMRTELRGDRLPPLPNDVPSVSGRVGVDLAPIDVRDDDAVRWAQALIWADQVHRIELFRSAVRLARQSPPRLIAGDGMDVLPSVVESVPHDATAVVFHSHCTYQMSEARRAEFDELLARLGRDRPLAHVSLEWIGEDSGPRMHLSERSGGRRDTQLLANYHSHGVWLEWLA